MNDPNACREMFHHCHCMLPTGHDGPHECVADPVCGGSWLRVDGDDPGMVRIYRYPNNRPGCDAYEATREMAGVDDPAPGEYVFEHDGIFRAPRGGIKFIAPSVLDIPGWQDKAVEFARAEERRLLELMRSPDA